MRNDSSTRIRQRLAVATGWCGLLLGVALVSTVLTGVGHIALLGVPLACFAYCVMMRPYLSLQADHIVVSNVLREVTLPWSGVSHARSRGSLVLVSTDGHATTSWAISSQKASRHEGESNGSMGGGRPSLHSIHPTPETLAAPSTSARALCELINAETVDNPVDAAPQRSVRWLPIPVSLMTLGAIFLIAALA